jgi:cell division protein FtsQ
MKPLKSLRDILNQRAARRNRKKRFGGEAEMQTPKFGFELVPGNKKWLLGGLASVKRKIDRHRRLKKENFASPARIHRLKKKATPCLLAATAVALFFMVDGPVQTGSLLRDVSMFKVRSLSVEGCRSLPVKDIVRLSQISRYKSSLLELDIAAIERRIEQEQWVQRAEVERNWPSEVVIRITEHHPVALVNMNSDGAPELYYLDRHGHPFMGVEPGEDIDYPVITGLDNIPDQVERGERLSEILEFLKRAARNNPHLPEQALSEIHLNRGGEMVIYLVDHPFPIFFGKGQTVTKFYRLLEVMRSLYAERQSETLLSGVAYIRMDYFNDKVLVAQSGSG